MYEDPIPHYLTFGNTATTTASDYHDHHLHNSGPTSPYEQHLDADQELQRLHQHQLLIQLRLEVNSLRTQIQQLELLKQQLVQQRDLMSPGEYDQMMDQFSRTSASLFSNAACRSRHDGGGGGGGMGGRRSGSSTPPFSLAGLDRIPDCMSFGGGGVGGSRGGGMAMMDRLQERLRNMTLQQQEYAQREHDQLHHQQYCQQLQQHGQGHQSSQQGAGGAMSPGARSRDPVRAEQTKLEAELRDLEQRMRSIQLLC
ncbi:MAG: hypothetical protein JOS17DRAFT_734016 [Linnemannia elongata]|nr:MAG: hypothetical protein JOS17DRAFT_734016 [Linnemannia elongata]